MNKKFNKKKINLIPDQKVLRYLIFIVVMFSLSFMAYYELTNKNRILNIVQNISEKFNYQLLDLDINSTNKVDKYEVIKIINSYYNQSIFLIPLQDISKSILNLKWVERVNLSTNLKDKIKIEIFEYEPVGLYFFNNQLFYFSDKGKIIDKYDENINKKFIVFYGSESLREADKFLNILNNIGNKSVINVNEAYYVNDRRWDVKLNNGIFLNLGERNIEESINNYIKLIKKFDDSETVSIKNIDLRNNEKAIISFK